ncbi:MAG: hypothetical protein JO299_14490 [Gammaproteobacteria bacterium]|nr:hypothetical protein [Gammaproteobacteria bacterium]
MRRLLAAISRGDRLAFRRLYFLYFPRLAKFLSQLLATSDSRLIEELIMEAMFRIWHESGALATRPSAHVCTMRIVFRCVCTRLPADDHPGHLAPKCPIPDLNGDGKSTARWERLHELLPALPVSQRAVIYLVYSGYSREQVTEILEMSCDSVDRCLASSRVVLDSWFARSSAPGRSEAS